MLLQDREKLKIARKQSQNQCSLCDQTFGLMSLNLKRFCVFCQNYVCRSHIVKRRKDPLKNNKLAKICCECEDHILDDMIMQKYRQKEQQQKEEEQELQQILEQYTHEIDQLNQELSSIKNQSNEEFLQKIDTYKNLIQEADKKIQTLNDEAAGLNEQHRKLLEYKSSVETTNQNLQQSLNKKKAEEKQIKNKVQELDSQITLIMEEINQIENERQAKRKLKNTYEQNSLAGTMGIISSEIIQSKPSKQRNQIKDKPINNKSYCGTLFNKS